MGITTIIHEGAARVKPKSRAMNTKIYLSLAERKQLIETLGDAPTLLFDFYLRKTGTPDYLYSDEIIAESIGWSVRKVQENRRKLIKDGWFFQATAIYPDKRKVTTTYLGQESVKKYHEGIDKLSGDYLGE